MAVIYLRSTDGDDSDDGSTWALAKATLVGALAAASAGDTIYVSHQHAESQSSQLDISVPGTAAAPVMIICVNDGAEPPTTLATTATVSTSGNYLITIDGFAYFYGISFTAGVGGTSSIPRFSLPGGTNPSGLVFESCVLAMGTSATTGYSEIGRVGSSAVQSQSVTLINTKLSHAANYSRCWRVSCDFAWRDTPSALAGSGNVEILLSYASMPSSDAVIDGVDLSGMGSGQYLVGLDGSYNKRFIFANCQLGSGVSIATASAAAAVGATVELINCDSSGTNYRYHKQTYQGTILHETTNVRTGGATDGTTPIARKMVSSANSQFFAPLELDCNVQWNETLSEQTVTVHILTDGVTLTNAECWLEVEYLGSADYPISSFASDRATDILATPANQAASTETWDETDISSAVKQKLEVTFTPAMKGPIKCRVMLAKPSTTVYVCPKVEIL